MYLYICVYNIYNNTPPFFFEHLMSDQKSDKKELMMRTIMVSNFRLSLSETSETSALPRLP